MEKVYRKPAVKSSSMYVFNLVNNPEQPTHVWDFRKYVIFKRDHEKDNLTFSFAPGHFLWTKFLKAKSPGTSYQSLWVEGLTYKNSFFGLTLWIWKLEREGKKRENIE